MFHVEQVLRNYTLAWKVLRNYPLFHVFPAFGRPDDVSRGTLGHFDPCAGLAGRRGEWPGDGGEGGDEAGVSEQIPGLPRFL